jgi:hypothetical protein
MKDKMKKERMNEGVKRITFGWAWWYIPVIQAFRMLRQKYHHFEASLGYM